MASILCVDDEPAVAVVLEHALELLGHTPVLRNSVADALKEMGRQPFDLVISDFRMPEQTGIDLLGLMQERGLDIPVIIMTGYSSIEHAVMSIRHGAVDYLTKPLRAEALRIAVSNALEVMRLRRENDAFRREINSLKGARIIVGESPALRDVLSTITTVAPTRATVLLEGESGTGKELFARALHEQSGRSGVLVTINCAALPEGLVESALFGHERGAFTGATARSAGAFERAHNGTLMLDEISEMRLDLQSKLLRAIQEQEFERVGGTQPIRVDVRLVATTNRKLQDEVAAGRFRQDLYYRLSVMPIRTPPLRERHGDVPLLVKHYVAHVASQLGTKPPIIVPEAIDFLQQQSWPGNIRELANAVERAVILCRNNRLTPDSFGFIAGGMPRTAATASPAAADAPFYAADGNGGEQPLDLETLEKQAIQRALAASQGHRGRAAELLGISERTLRNKLNPRPDKTA